MDAGLVGGMGVGCGVWGALRASASAEIDQIVRVHQACCRSHHTLIPRKTYAAELVTVREHKGRHPPVYRRPVISWRQGLIQN